MSRSFASDNNAGVHPEVMTALQAANQDHVIAYGDDPYTKRAEERIKSLFTEDLDVFFVFNGTAANVLGITASAHPFNAVFCAETAHINQDECGAPERFAGCKLTAIQTPDGKLTPGHVMPHLHGFGFEHHSQPGVISITQSTEMGTVYEPTEIRALAELAHSHNMVLHMDGTRLANAAASLNSDVNTISGRAGVDVLSFGATKNGLMYGEAVVFFNRKLANNFKYIRKQGMQLASKMRFISAQFEAYLTNDLYLRNAKHANDMAQLLAKQVSDIQEIRITQKVQSNGVFAIIPQHLIKPLQEHYFFYMWNEAENEVRWMCSFDTTEEDVTRFTSLIRKLLKKQN
jgi:threonine aldolase